jgi:hypothetical protein
MRQKCRPKPAGACAKTKEVWCGITHDLVKCHKDVAVQGDARSQCEDRISDKRPVTS